MRANGQSQWLHSLLANQYPAYKTLFSQVNGAAALAFGAAYPTSSHLKGITIDELADFLYQKSNHRLGREASCKKAQHILESCHFFFPKTLAFMSRQLVDLTKVITHRFPLTDVLKAFELGKKASDSAKILLIP